MVVRCTKRPDLRHLCLLILRSQPVITSTRLWRTDRFDRSRCPARVTMPARLLARRAEAIRPDALAVTHGPGCTLSQSLETSWLKASSSC
jgi:hypothetical protein